MHSCSIQFNFKEDESNRRRMKNEDESNRFEIYSLKLNCVLQLYMHTLFVISLVLYLLKLSAGRGFHNSSLSIIYFSHNARVN